MEYTKGFEALGLPENFKFGIELEAYNVKTKGKNSLYNGESAEFIKNKNWHMATKSEEMLVVFFGGAYFRTCRSCPKRRTGSAKSHSF